MRIVSGVRGTTLIELIVVLAIVGLLFGVAIPALTSVPPTVSDESGLDSFRLASVRSGAVTHRALRDTVAAMTALPDGRLIGGGRHDAR
ncbi:MAG: prepilin-type N-terminal cleavage/methylation domain-containing protein [Candidatus Limnocylindria bacterium]